MATPWKPERLLRTIVGRFGFELGRPAPPPGRVAVESSESDEKIQEFVRPFTMTSRERIWALINATAYVADRRIPGDFCECGVWRGGSSMAMAMKLRERGDLRRLWMYDTFTGMPAPESVDRAAGSGQPASELMDVEVVRAEASLGDVQSNMRRTGYPDAMVRYVPGKVEETLAVAENVPDRIALLRLDTDWYASTKCELEVLYERLSPSGVLIIDDYGHWEGARRAVDEFFGSRPKPLLHAIDYTGRICVKV